MVLYEFLVQRREEVLRDARDLIEAIRPGSAAVGAARNENLPGFLDAVIADLRRRETLPPDPVQPPRGSGPTGTLARWSEYDVDEVVHQYGSLCTSIMKVAERHGHSISTRQHQALNQALDENIAEDVLEHERRRRDETRYRSAERLGFVAHELRNALHTAALSFQAIRTGHVSVQGVTGGVLERSHHRLRDLVERLLAQVRLGAGALLRRERLQVAKLVQESVAYVGTDARDKGIQVVVESHPGVETEGDGTLLTSAFTNLLQNAVKFTPSGKQVRLRSSRLDGRARIEVEDECGGLDAGTAKVIFSPFVQTGEDRSGLGLGLTIVREIVAAHSGTIDVRDLPGRGCVFIIELPAPAPS